MPKSQRKNQAPGTSRREFIQAAGSAAVVAAVGPAILSASDKSGRKLPVIGSGAHKYEAVHGWGELPEHVQWGDTHGVAIDKQGLVYIKHRSDAPEPMDSIVVFDAEGKFVRSFGKPYHHGGHGIDIREDGGQEYLYLCDIHNRQVIKATLTGEEVWKMSFPAEAGVYESVEGFRPTNVAFGPDGGFYVADGYGSNYIHQYGKDAKWVRTWGGTGTEAGKMQTPHGIWLDDRAGREPSLVVADRANARLQYFTLEGEHLGFVNEVSFPAHFDIRGSELLVADLHARVSIFDADNKVVAHLGYDPAWTENVMANQLRGKADQWQPGRFVHPHDACYDAAGNIFVVEWVPIGRVTFLRHVG